ncbi:rod shape-determining protein MreD [Hydrocarboniphaga sp.]|uniref:rod shape-determining protein MreD n=1 Tax=Hydrocarboniphaga sp. TaxID=2033016 RepID=UPI002610D63A|nr:rod shape-determining protein MreD [Hydrocarboniphaga sp.]
MPHLAFWLSLFAALFLQMVVLPDSIAAVRPLWVPLVLAFWALQDPRLPTLIASFLFGIMLDVLFDSILGQHALACVLCIYIVIKLRSLFILFPLWQSTVALLPVWLIYAFLMFWIDGVAKHQADPWLRWLPVASTALFWPLIFVLLDSYLRRRQRSQE